ncbi:hypothetical protein [Streptacidiphilus jiangxiensis]|uniref:Uncharacterized protein n=1 Tax=Streptacidiphilus jiangxiensis TaxID=235985 RepID=A0A1H7NQM9_STRJI|nr:hypothetical protein [Streptacidiphilus jiangxiensis]SEL25631.1 hypothetical protein SAMN05414137_10724 [Streptacidiphilus jiangxiensis]
MLVRTEKTPQIPRKPMTVKVHSPIGVATVRWCGDPQEADGDHLVEWTVDEDILWGHNTQAVALAEPELREEGSRVVMRGLLHLAEDGPCLELGDSLVLFDLASPIPVSVDGTWVEISVEADNVALYPYRT